MKNTPQNQPAEAPSFGGITASYEDAIAFVIRKIDEGYERLSKMSPVGALISLDQETTKSAMMTIHMTEAIAFIYGKTDGEVSADIEAKLKEKIDG